MTLCKLVSIRLALFLDKNKTQTCRTDGMKSVKSEK